jgi:adenylate cyclase
MRLPLRPRFRLPRRLPIRLPEWDVNKALAAAVIALSATVVAVTLHTVPVSSRQGRALDQRPTLLTPLNNLAYDGLYVWRAPADRKGGPVVIIDVDKTSLRAMDDGLLGSPFGWPWPRSLYGSLVRYFRACGARVVGFDLLFTEVTAYRSRGGGDDVDFGFAVDEVQKAGMPVVFGAIIAPDGKPERFKIPLDTPPDFGAVNFEGGVFRTYAAAAHGVPTLGHRLASIYANKPAIIGGPFWLHYYGPPFKTLAPDGSDRGITFNYVAAYRLLPTALAFEDGDEAKRKAAEAEAGIDPDFFRGKIILVGGTAPVLLDEKSAPRYNPYPGVEVHATAIENLLFYNRVHWIGRAPVAFITLLVAALAAVGVLYPRGAVLKLTAVVALVVALWAVAVLLFRGRTIYFLPLPAPYFGVALSAGPALAYSYFTEGRQRRFISRAFALSTSPVIAEALERNPKLLNLGGERREITVMFTDLAGFTDLSETMEVVKLAEVINRYMEAMSEVIVAQDGYVDKYIGDAIMAFWNGLGVDQPDHAARACRAALGIKRREVEIAAELQKLVPAKILTRIGVNTGPMAVGNLGSSRKLAYTVLGDAVNLGARLEPANKIYGSEVLVSQTTAEQVTGQFVMRQLDLLRVKGKQRPMAVYELMGEGEPDALLALRVRLYEEGLSLYRAQRWDAAEGVLLDLLRQFPSDAPAQALLARVGKLRHEPPAPDWDGVYVAKEK